MERSSRFISLERLERRECRVMCIGRCLISYGYVYGDAEQRSIRMLEYDVSGPFSILFNNKLDRRWHFCGCLNQCVYLYPGQKAEGGDPCLAARPGRLMINVSIPLLVGAVFLVQLIEYGNPALVAPGASFSTDWSLLVASKYTLIEIRYLAYSQLDTGADQPRFVGHGLIF